MQDERDAYRRDDVQTSRDHTRGEGAARPNPESEKVDTTGGGEPIPGAESISEGVHLPDNVAEESLGNDTVSRSETDNG